MSSKIFYTLAIVLGLIISGINSCMAIEEIVKENNINTVKEEIHEPIVENKIEASLQENVYYTNRSYTSRKYILGPNDIINISFLGIPEFNKQNARIQPDGFLTLDLPEPVFVAGQSIGELQILLEEKYKYYIVDPHVSINLVETKPFIVYVGGAVINPGSYELDTNPKKANSSENFERETTISRRTPLLSNILVAAGGIRFDADLEHILIQNKFTNEEYEINVLDLLETGNSAQDIYLTAGDSVYVPKLNTAYEVTDEKYKKYMSSTVSPNQVPVRVYGYVNKPGVIFLETKFSMNLNSAITQAGGYLTARAKPPKKIYLSRTDGNGKMVTKTVNPTKEDMVLRPNDIIYVPEKTRATIVQFFDDLSRVFNPANVLANTYNGWALVFDKNRYSGAQQSN